jgi:hypothetical protein
MSLAPSHMRVRSALGGGLYEWLAFIQKYLYFIGCAKSIVIFNKNELIVQRGRSPRAMITRIRTMGGARSKVVEVVIVVIIPKWCCGEPMTILLSASNWVQISRTSTEQSFTPWGRMSTIKQTFCNVCVPRKENCIIPLCGTQELKDNCRSIKGCSENPERIGDPIDGPVRYSVVRP